MDSKGESSSSGTKRGSSSSKPNSSWARLVSANLMHSDMEIQGDEVINSSNMGLGSYDTQICCKIYRNLDSGIVKLQNLSSCGILINGQLLGKDENIIIGNGNEIIFGPEREGYPIYHFYSMCGDQHGKLSQKVSSIVDNMKCSICLNLWHDVVSVTPCLHNFCNACFSQWYKRAGEKGIKLICPQCRSDIYSVGRNHSLRNIVEMIIGKPGAQRSAFAESSGSDDESWNDDILVQCPQCVHNRGPGGGGFHCVQETIHVTCQACWGKMPLRTDITIPQMCVGCEKYLCGVYWNSQNTINARSRFNIRCNIDELIPISRRTFLEVPEQTHGGNIIEQDVTRRYIHEQGKTISEIVQVWNVKLDAGEIDQPRLPANPVERITSTTHLCNACAKRVAAHVLHQFRLSIPKSELPPDAARRDNCWWGHRCRTQHHNMDHAQKRNHVCEPTRRA